jgi:hypothetical protein
VALIITGRFQRAYHALPAHVRQKVHKALRLLVEDAGYPSARVHRVQGTDHIHEARVDRSYRLSFQFEGQDILLRNVDSHDECLKNP